VTWQPIPPAPAPPAIRVYLTPGAGQPQVEITTYLSQETAPVLTETIEDPTGTNSFTAGDVTLKGYDPTGFVQGLFANMGPASADWSIFINLGLTGADSATPTIPQVQFDVQFFGIVQPSTWQFNAKDSSFSFTVISSVKALQNTSAVPLFQRSSYFDGKWTLQQDASTKDPFTLRVTGPTVAGFLLNFVCDFLAGDTIQVNGADVLVVAGVSPDPAQSGTAPGNFWELTLSTPIQKNYAVGQVVNLLTPYQRNLPLESVVTTLFNAAGFPAEGYFSAPALPGISTLFATPLPPTGMPAGAIQGIAAGDVLPGFQAPILAGTAFGLYRAPDAISPFALINSSSTGPLIDDTNTEAGFIFQNAPKRTKSRNNAPRFGLNVTFKFYAYDGKFYGATFNRYCLTVSCNADVDSPTFSFSSVLTWETQNPASYVWTSQGTLQTLISGTTTTDMSRLYDAIGIEVDSNTGTCFFTDIQNSAGAGSAITMNTSAWQPAGATIAGGTYQANKATGVNGPIVMLAKASAAFGPNSFIGVAQVDGILGKSPNVFVYTVAANGTMTLFTTAMTTPYLIGRSIKRNRGDARFYGLTSDPNVGVSIVSWGPTFGVDALSTPILLAPPPNVPAQSASLLGRPMDVDLIILRGTGLDGSGQFPFVALFGGAMWSISKTFTASIAYADMTGLSVSDALQQLSLLNAGIFYFAPFGWVFRSRSGPMPGNTIGTNDQIDGDPGFLSMVTQSVFNRWTGYVRFENENDSTIFGFAGNPAFQDTDSGLTLKSRFLTSSVNAQALATSLFSYLGAKKRWVEIERVRDGRSYTIGYTFHAVSDGLNRNFQIIESDHPVTGVTVKVVGLEV
jgi:hypothetical protein